jgi:hypothetical protein
MKFPNIFYCRTAARLIIYPVCFNGRPLSVNWTEYRSRHPERGTMVRPSPATLLDAIDIIHKYPDVHQVLLEVAAELQDLVLRKFPGPVLSEEERKIGYGFESDSIDIVFGISPLKNINTYQSLDSERCIYRRPPEFTERKGQASQACESAACQAVPVPEYQGF